LQGSITDEAGRELAYVSIGIAGTSTGTVSKPDGSFRLLLPAVPNPTDTLRISHIGYQTLSFPLEKTVDKTSEKLSFTLYPATRQLTTIEIKPGETKRKTFGSRREHTVISTNFAITDQPLQNLGAAIGKRFNLKGKPHFLQELNMFVAYNNFDTVVFRLQVHKLRNGKPAGSLLTENIYFTLVKHRKGWATFDLKPYALVFNEKVLLSLEWVGHSAKGKYIGLPLAMPLPGAVHYYKFGSQAHWKVYHTMSTSINLVTETGK
ncbi:MAG TPA: carboxypeptidase-like regulatory domain-containing protein, partial [Adhaeribacter sp.]|nr:carboxypeptidase-like regulatory domain-containing protein [Adhaeribacter sp.]